MTLMHMKQFSEGYFFCFVARMFKINLKIVLITW